VNHLQTLTAICNLPTAPYREQLVVAWLLEWAKQRRIHVTRDGVGNVYLHYRRGKPFKRPLIIEAHMDHPGFVVKKQRRDGTIEAAFRGGVKPSLFEKARAKFFTDRWHPTRVLTVKPNKKSRFLDVTLAAVKEKLPPGTLGMWDLPDAVIENGLFKSRVCDDLGGVAAIVCLFEELLDQKIDGHVIGLCSRAEEVGFGGVLAACENKWLPKNAVIIGLETSKASDFAKQGNGAIIRVGDRTGLFSLGLTHFVTQAAASIADDDKHFKYQRALMSGGTCNTTAVTAYGFDATCLCVALGNYHNQHVKGDPGYGDAPKAGPGIASETIHTGDFLGMVGILVAVVQRFKTYTPGVDFLRERFHKLHRDEQVALFKTTPL